MIDRKLFDLGILAFSAFMLSAAQLTMAKVPCDEGARYYRLAQKSGGAQDFAKATLWLTKSVSACPSYDAYHLLGAAYKKQRLLGESLNAYEKAVEYASEADKAAISLARYGQVLSLNGQRYEALTMLERAIDMHSQPPAWIRSTAKELDVSLASKPVSSESIKRSLASQEFGLLSLTKFSKTNKTGNGSKPMPAKKTKIGIPINFQYNSVMMDQLTSENVGQLGAALADEAYNGRTFTLVGHTDVRGDWAYNLDLSRQRASAARNALLVAYPQLEGRLTIKGEGETNPKYSGDSLRETDHRLNRRLEVWVN
ncbi:MAG: OmpA family protein [Pseudomonadales bacterium]